MDMKQKINEAAEDDRLVIGHKETLKAVDDLEEVILASNTPEDIRARVVDAAEDSDVDVSAFDGTNKALGSLCRKPFGASTVGIKKVTNLK